MTATEATISINHVDLYTRVVGTGPPVVVLHGGPGAHHDYLLPQFDSLAVERQLVYYDQRGGGRSPVARDVPVTWREHVADLAAIIRHRGLLPATLVGYSWGGLLALLYAVEHGADIARLALVSPAPITAAGRREFERRYAERMNAPPLIEARREVRESGLRDRDPDAYRLRMFELSVAGYFHQLDNVRNLTPFRVTGRTQQATWTSLGEYDLQDRIRQLRIPSLVLHGLHDPIPLDTARQTAVLLDAPLVIAKQSGHVPYVEDFDLFRATLDDFLPTAS